MDFKPSQGYGIPTPVSERDRHEMDFLTNGMKALSQFEDINVQNRLLKDLIGEVINQRNGRISSLFKQVEDCHTEMNKLGESIKDLTSANLKSEL